MNIYHLFKNYQPSAFQPYDLKSYWLQYYKDKEDIQQYCIRDYQKLGFDWEALAIKKVFNYHEEDIKRMHQAAKLLEQALSQVEEKAKTFFHLSELPVVDAYIYHGLGNGAGSFMVWNHKPSLWFGLEKIVELNWDEHMKLFDLVAHEYTHFLHQSIGQRSLEPTLDFKETYLYKIYVEGLATYGESIFFGRDISMEAWHKNAKSIQDLLKSIFNEYYQSENEKIQNFFGDWYPVEGIIEAGYFLGLEWVQKMMKETSFDILCQWPKSTIFRSIKQYLQLEE